MINLNISIANKLTYVEMVSQKLKFKLLSFNKLILNKFINKEFIYFAKFWT